MENQWERSGVFVDLKYLLENKDRQNVILADTRSEEDYLKGHIPGAVCLGKGKTKAGMLLRDDLIDMGPVEEVAQILGSCGVSAESEIILYGGKSDPYATVVYWILNVLGNENVSYYNGGIDGARSGGITLETSPNILGPVKFEPKVNSELTATTEEVFENLNNNNSQLVDVRAKGEVNGKVVTAALRGGKIPGAIHINMMDNWKDLKSKELKPVEELKKLYGGLDPEKEVTVHCQTGTRSAYTYTVLKALGFKKIKNYDESWIFWGNRLDLPIENGQWFGLKTLRSFGSWGMFLGVLGIIAEGIKRKLTGK